MLTLREAERLRPTACLLFDDERGERFGTGLASNDTRPRVSLVRTGCVARPGETSSQDALDNRCTKVELHARSEDLHLASAVVLKPGLKGADLIAARGYVKSVALSHWTQNLANPS